MSNFYCEKCGASILEDRNGIYVTGCQHYPMAKKFPSKLRKKLAKLDHKFNKAHGKPLKLKRLLKQGIAVNKKLDPKRHEKEGNND